MVKWGEKSVEMSFRIYQAGIYCLFFSIVLFLFLLPPFLHAAPSESIIFTSPDNGVTIISKKPVIECSIEASYQRESLYVLLDQTDVSDLAVFTNKGFSIKPFLVLPAGQHRVYVSFEDEYGQLHEGEISFTSRQSEPFETAVSNNSISAVYSRVIAKTGDAKSRPLSDWGVEGNLSTENTIAQDSYKVSLQANARYIDQEKGLEEPLEKGVELVDFLLKGDVDAGGASLSGAIGDVSIEGTEYTIGSLSRRGVTLGASSVHYNLNGFSVKSQNTYGNNDGDHLSGVIGGARFFDEEVKVTTIYVNGRKDADVSSYNIWPTPSDTDGDAYGFEVVTDFFENMLITRVEAGFSDYDSDTTDDFGSESDTMYMGQLSGAIDFLDYNFLYEHIGTDYKVVTSSLQGDREGFRGSTGFSFADQYLSFTVGKYNDNLDEDPAIARLETLQYGVNYNLNAFTSWPITVNWQHSDQDSSLEPAGTSEIKNSTDTFFGSISYSRDAFIVGVQPEYTQIEDDTTADYDTRSVSLSVFSGYSGEKFSISPSVSFSRIEDINQNIESDNVSCNLSFTLNITEGLDIEGFAAYGLSDANDNSIDQDTFSGDLQMSYTPLEPIGGVFIPTIQLLASHAESTDDIANTDNSENLVYLILSGKLDLSF